MRLTASVSEYIVTALLTLVSPIAVSSQTVVGDSVVRLGEVVVSARDPRPLLTDSSGATLLNAAWLNRMPKVLGNADPLRLMQSLPGVHTNSEYDSGIHIDGSETSHVAMLLGGVPVYGASHLLGFFSVFNAPHFSALRIQRKTFGTVSHARLGAEADMLLPNDVPLCGVDGEAEVGLMSSQATLRLRCSAKSALFLSARRSYLNLLYGGLLKMDDMSLRYGFGDYNLTMLHKPTDNDVITVNLYGGNDAATMREYNYQAELQADWNNMLASVEWKHRTGKSAMSAKTYVTRYANTLNVDEESIVAKLQSDITEAAVEAGIDINRLGFGLRYSRFWITPQSPKITGLSQNSVKSSCFGLLSAYAAYSHDLGKKLSLKAGARGNWCEAQGYALWTVDPSLGMLVDFGSKGRLDVSLGMQSQYLWQTGFTSIGLPTEFWVGPSDVADSDKPKPQKAYGIDMAYCYQSDGSPWRMELRAYYKCLANQVEYKGDVLELLSAYNLQNNIYRGKGHNIGFSVSVQKTAGRLTGWIAYSWQRCRRRFSGLANREAFPSNHERPHEINAVGTWRLNKRIDFGANYVYASGTPFTAPDEMFLINGNMVTQYGKHNSNRLPAYMRLDLSMSYAFNPVNGHSHGLNVSLYNALAHRNAVFYRLKYVEKGEAIAYRPIHFPLRVMPSVSYYFRI